MNLKEPRCERPPLIVFAEIFETLDQRNLGQFAGIIPIAREMIGHTQEIIAVCVDDFAKTVFVSG